MTRVNPQLLLQRSFVDRATNTPRAGEEARLADLRDALRRDLQRLLNTRIPTSRYPAGLTELKVSLVNYGLPDVGAIGVNAADVRPAMRQIIEDTIRGFEHRLASKSVRVTLTGENQPLDRTMRFRVEEIGRASCRERV